MSSTPRSVLVGQGLLLVMLVCPTASQVDHLSAQLQSFPKWAHDAFPTHFGGRPSPDNRESPRIDEQCSKDIGTYQLALLFSQPWAINMLDAEFTIPAGTRDGNFHWLGSYDQCIRQKVTDSNFTVAPGWVVKHTFSAKYCTVNWFQAIIGALALCVPDSCSEADVYAIVTSNTSEIYVPNAWSVTCSGNEPVYSKDGSAIAATVVLSFFGALVLLATIADYVKTCKVTSKQATDKSGQVNRSYIGSTGDEGGAQIIVLHGGRDNIGADSREVAMDATPRNDGDSIVINKEKTMNNARSTGSDGEDVTPEAKDTEEIVVKFRGNTQQDPIAVCNGKTGNSFELAEIGNEDRPKEKKESMLLSLLLCFSLRRNIPAVTSAKHPKGSFQCLNGIRFLSMCWILLGHTWVLGTYILARPDYIATENMFRFGDFFARPSYSVIRNMNLGVESFFVLSASLTTISFIKQCDRNGGRPTCRQMALYYFHRYWRLFCKLLNLPWLTPVYAMIMMTFTCFFLLLGSGPIFPREFSEAANCRYNWWVNLLYLNNFVNLDGLCMGWTWYLANDFQFYVAAPLFVFLLYKWPIAGGIFLLLGFGGHLVSTIIILRPSPDFIIWYLEYYIRPWCRFGPYAIGIALGYIMYRTKCKQKMHWTLVVLGWLIALFFICAAVYGDFRRTTEPCKDCNPWNDHLRTAFQATFRDFFSLGIAWMIFACCSGYGGIVDTILSWKLWIPLGRLTFTGYLLHPIIIYYNMYTRRRLLYVQDSTMIVLFCGYLLLTLGMSFVFTLVFEVPMLHLERVIIPRKH